MQLIAQLCRASDRQLIEHAEARLEAFDRGDLSDESLLEAGLIAACVNNDFSPSLQPIIERWQAQLQARLRSADLSDETRHQLRCLLAIWWSLFKQKHQHKSDATDPMLVEFFSLSVKSALHETLVAVGQIMVSTTSAVERASALLRLSAIFYELSGETAFREYMMRVFSAAIVYPFPPHLIPNVIVAAVHTEFDVMPFQTELDLLQVERLPIWMRSWHLHQICPAALAQVAENAARLELDPTTKQVLDELCKTRL
ncbi:MAG: hypothetical protein U0136_13885 [Bdellovibrionota bacterium]